MNSGCHNSVSARRLENSDSMEHDCIRLPGPVLILARVLCRVLRTDLANVIPAKISQTLPQHGAWKSAKGITTTELERLPISPFQVPLLVRGWPRYGCWQSRALDNVMPGQHFSAAVKNFTRRGQSDCRVNDTGQNRIGDSSICSAAAVKDFGLWFNKGQFIAT